MTAVSPAPDATCPADRSVVLRYGPAATLETDPIRRTRLLDLLSQGSIREGLRLVEIGAANGVVVHVLDETSLMHTGTLKSVDGCVTTARARLEGYDRICFESGGNTGMALTAYGRQAGLETFLFVPAASLPHLDSRAFAGDGAHLVVVDDPRHVKATTAAFAARTGIPRVPRAAWRREASTFIGCFVLEALDGGARVDAIYQGISAAFAPLGIYRVLGERGGHHPLPRFVGVQQAARAPMVQRWIARRGGAFAPGDVEPLSTVMYDDSPQEYGTFDDLDRLIDATRGRLTTADRDVFARLYAPFDGATSVIARLGACDIAITCRAGEVTDRTGLMALARAIVDAEAGSVPPGTHVLVCVTGGSAAPDGRARAHYHVADTGDHAARIVDALGVNGGAHA
jgi:threonine synthase